MALGVFGVVLGQGLPNGQRLLVGFLRLRRSSSSVVQKSQVILASGQVTLIVLLIGIVARELGKDVQGLFIGGYRLVLVIDLLGDGPQPQAGVSEFSAHVRIVTALGHKLLVERHRRLQQLLA